MLPFVSFLNGAVAMARIFASIAFLLARQPRPAVRVLRGGFLGLRLQLDPDRRDRSGAESRHWFYVLRLLAFALIAIGIVDKNRSLGRRRDAAHLGSREDRRGMPIRDSATC